ncbi:hypothetical protein AMECASPLE_034657 [Ameca splendens]|uniref:CCHC-type domain-containing protein n=1 Tax=Ameca splendens TaxID=208324 RepID=A0ABV0XK58_9TELE
MEDNPDMAGADAGTWDRHLIHHLSKIREEHKKDEEELKTLQTQLLKTQLAEAKQKAGEKKKENKTPKIMYEGAVSQGPQPPPFPGHQDTIAPRSANSGPYHAQPGRFRGRGGPRGRGFRGGPPGRWGGADVCYYCEEQGHWMRECPYYLEAYARGYGPRGGPGRRPYRGRGGPPREGQQQQPSLQLPAWDEPSLGPDHY